MQSGNAELWMSSHRRIYLEEVTEKAFAQTWALIPGNLY